MVSLRQPRRSVVITVLTVVFLIAAGGFALGSVHAVQDHPANVTSSSAETMDSDDDVTTALRDVIATYEMSNAPIVKSTIVIPYESRESSTAEQNPPARVPDQLQQASPEEACKTGFDEGSTADQAIEPQRLSTARINQMVSRYNEAIGEQNLPDFVGDLVEDRMLIRVTRGPSHDSTVQLFGVQTGANNRVTDVTKLDADSISSFDPQVELKVESGVADGLATAEDPTQMAKQALKTGRIDVDGRGVANSVKYEVVERVGRIQTKYFESEPESAFDVAAGETKTTNWQGSNVTVHKDTLGRTVVSAASEQRGALPGDATVVEPTTGISVGVLPGGCCRSLMSVNTGELSASAGVYASIAEVGCPWECSVDGSHTAKVEMVLVQQGWDPDEYDSAREWIDVASTLGSVLAGDVTGALKGGEFLDTGFTAAKTRGFTVWAKATCRECDVNTCYGCWEESDLVHDGVRYKKVAEFHEGVRATGDTDGDGKTEFTPNRKPDGYVGADFSWKKFYDQLFVPKANELRLNCHNGGFN